jgi:WD40 repeat protein/tRNA A-37 threonylcarbamoyl transferase component Bud32
MTDATSPGDATPPPSIADADRTHGETPVDLHAATQAFLPPDPNGVTVASPSVAEMEAFLGLGGGGVPDSSEVTPALVPGYELLEELGRGGMGVVYKARQVKANRVVALKMILARAHASLENKVRFQIEAEAIASLQHPHIVQLHDVGEHDGLPFFSLEFCDGGSLDGRLKTATMGAREAAHLVEKLARAMHYAHLRGVVHRDLKPSNVLLGADGTPKITDFGLAKHLDSASDLSRTGAVMGTPSYMSPEQAAGKVRDTGPASDVYALGAILYELLAGQPPFKAATAFATILQVLHEEPALPSRLRPGVPRDLETICLKCLQKEPVRRYTSAEALADDLSLFQAGKPVVARPLGSLARGWRWCRRNPAVAASVAVVALSLLAATLVSFRFGVRADQARRSAETALTAEAERALSEEAAKKDAEFARRAAQRQLIDVCSASGLTAAGEGDHTLALLWFARAVQLAGDEPRQQELNRTRISNWLRQVSLPEGTFTIPGFRRGQDRMRTFRFSPNGDYLLVTASTGDCLVWDRPRQRLAALPGSASKGSAAVWQPGSGLLAVAEKGGTIRLLAPTEFRPVDKVEAGQEITVLAFSRDGKRLALGGPEGARVWDQEKKEYVSPLLAHGGAVASLSFSASGELLATSARDGKVRVFRIAPGEREPLFPPVDAEVSGEDGTNHGGTDQVGPRFAADDQVLLTVERTSQRNHELTWRSATTGKLIGSTNIGHWTLNSFAVSPRGDRVAAFWAVDGGMGRLLDTRTRGILAAIPTKSGIIEDTAFGDDGKTLVVGSSDMMAQFWSVDDRPNLSLVPSQPTILHPNPVVRVSLTADGQWAAAALWDGRTYLWRLPEGIPIAYSVPVGGTTLFALSPDRRFVLPRGTSYMNGTLLQTLVYSAESGEPAGQQLDPGGILLNAAFSPDGTKVATASSTAKTVQQRSTFGYGFQPDGQAGNVQIWDWKTGKRLAGPIATPTEPRGLAFSPDGRSLAVVCADYRVLLVNPDTAAIVRRLDPGMRSYPSLANLWWSNGEARFSPDGRYLVTWELATTMHVWDPDSGKLLHSLSHDGRVEQVCFNPRITNLLATGGRDPVVRIWDSSTGKLSRELAHSRFCGPIHFSTDGTELVTSDAEMVRAWDWKTGTLKGGVSASLAAFTSDRRWLVAFCSRETGGGSRIQVIDWQTRTPASPRWKIGELNLDICIPAGDRRVIVTGFSRSMTGYDLERMVTPAAAATEDLVPLAELAAGRRILNEGRVVPLTSAEWSERWQRLQPVGNPLLP